MTPEESQQAQWKIEQRHQQKWDVRLAIEANHDVGHFLEKAFAQCGPDQCDLATHLGQARHRNSLALQSLLAAEINLGETTLQEAGPKT